MEVISLRLTLVSSDSSLFFRTHHFKVSLEVVSPQETGTDL